MSQADVTPIDGKGARSTTKGVAMFGRSPAGRARRDLVVRILLGIAASSSVIAMLAIFIFRLKESIPSIRYSGASFLTSVKWDIGNLYASSYVVRHGVRAPLGATYGIWPFIFGTLTSTLIAIVIAIPISVGSALLLTEYLPQRATLPISFVIELLAGVPSVVFGLWALVVLVPWVTTAIGPFIGHILGFIPFFRATTAGQGLLAAGIVLGIMIIPIITATSRDVIAQAPPDVKAGAHALGATKWETIRLVSLPWARTGITGGIILGIGRALGETMAVLMIAGNAVGTLPTNLMSPISTMAAVIVAQLDSALQDPTGLAVSALAEIALVLFLITVAVAIPGRLLVARQARARGGAA